MEKSQAVESASKPTTQSVSLNAQNKPNKYVIIILLLFLLSLSFAGLGSYYGYRKCQLKEDISKLATLTTPPIEPSPTLEQKTDLNTFTSVRNSYTFDYNKYEFFKNLSDDKASVAGPDFISFEVEVIETDISDPEEWWKSQKIDARFNLSVEDFTTEETTVSGKPAIKVLLKPGKWQGPGGTEELYLVIYNKKLYKLRVGDRLTFSSFKFL